jgi:methyl-accepting chemotaxis protein
MIPNATMQAPSAPPLFPEATKAQTPQVQAQQASAPSNIFSTLNFARNLSEGQLSLIGKIVLVVSCVAYLFTLQGSSPQEQKIGKMAQDTIGGLQSLANGINGLSSSSKNIEKAAKELQKSVEDAGSAVKNLYESVSGVATPFFNLFTEPQTSTASVPVQA